MSSVDPRAIVASLPEDDPVIAALGDGARLAATEAWKWRASSERTASEVFARITDDLRRDVASADVIALASAAIAQELGHSEVAHAVACRYSAEPVPPPGARTLDAPRFGDADARTNRLLFLTLHCCINETIAAGYLRACLQEAVGPVARAAVRILLADEIDHARIGWAHLASPHVSAVDRAHVSGALPVLLRLARAAWLAPIPGTEALEAGHGCLLDTSLRQTVTEAIDEVVLPGFRHVGIVP